ncbi:response regulator [Desulfosudis oleivorans]|uniref:Response regulator receiver protein n=1 Tax=Desulfosudis oleivorans (strain DSM 6200 / JCM 39069 / Hxd3) TaxID=96561 RepID=A8ZYQ1_DESOH|nr:response regulator [Desulfosudis oleivorans]ABW67156.1 response regulator receiver protein [Desulfosudis oleivorans Hxd3]
MVNVLFVDDEAGFLDIITKRMTKRGVASVGIADGEEALSLIEKQPFDVVVLDVRMPGCRSGIEILKEIKTRWPLVEVIMLTGHALLEVAKTGMENGAFDYLVKPADFDELYYKIRDAGQKKKLQETKIKGIDDIMKKQV